MTACVIARPCLSPDWVVKIGGFVYRFREVPCEIGGRGFACHRHGRAGAYHVRVGGDGPSCECLGFLRWDHCRHVAAVHYVIG